MKALLSFVFVVAFAMQMPAQPVITSFTPSSGGVGSTVTLSGSNFSATPSANIVFIGGVRASVTSASFTTVTVTVPKGGMAVPISLTTNDLTCYSRLPFTITFAGASSLFTPGSFTFAGGVDSVHSNIETTTYTTGDIDGDGKLDGVAVDRLQNTVSVYRNTSTNGKVSFASAVNLPTGTSPRSVSCGDVDGDGLQDIIVSNLTANTVSVFRNTSTTGLISFLPKVDFGTATQPAEIAIDDIDKDGKPDLVINSINANGTISILRNTSSGRAISFNPKIDLNSVGGSIEELETADLDGDNRPEIIVPNYSLNKISIFRNTSNTGVISFAPKLDVGTYDNPSDIAIGDLNNDGKPDMAISYYGFNNNILLYTNSSGAGLVSFASAINLAVGNSVDAIAINDLDGDGKRDLIVASGVDSVCLFKNNSAPGGAISLGAVKRFQSLGYGPILTGDFDNDGMADIALKLGAYRMVILKNTTTFPYIQSFTPVITGSGSTVTITGVNFNAATMVTFGNQAAASFRVINSTTITAVIGSGATGAVGVTTTAGSTSKAGFTYAPQPIINSFTPTAGSTSTIVNISGNYLNGATGVSFGNIASSAFTVINPTTIQATVASGATGAVVVTTPGGSATLNGFVFVPPPGIISFSPASGGPQTAVTISGTNFNNITSVRFGGTLAASFIVNSSTLITAIVGAGSSGNVSLTSTYGNAIIPGFIFLPPAPPVLNTFSPASGTVGATVAVSGSGFNSNALQNIVYFGATRATVVSATATQLTVTVPAGATFEPISVYNKDTYVTGFSSQPFILTFTGGEPVFSALSFSKHTDFPVGKIAGAITLRDLDGDGKADVIFGDDFTGINVLKNTSMSGVASFSPGIEMGLSSPFFGVTTTDVDGDGLPDLVAVNDWGTAEANSRFLVMRNISASGNLAFGPRLEYFAQIGTPRLETADLNKDGKPDIIITNSTTRTISVFTNTSTPGEVSFGPRLDFPTSGLSPQTIIASDLDGDQWPDLAVNNSFDSTISIFKNITGAGVISFSPVRRIYLKQGTQGIITAGDLDGDGKSELVITHRFEIDKFITVLKNTSVPGTISFGTSVDYPVPVNPGNVSISDVNGDGKPDIIVTGGDYESTLLLFSNTSTSTELSFAPVIQANVPGLSLYGLAIGDLDGDNKPDIVTTNQQSKITVYSNQADVFIDRKVCAGSSISLVSNVSGTSYQWQINTGTGFVNLVNNVNYNNVSTQTLQISNIPLTFNNYQYRCMIESTSGKITVLLLSASPPSAKIVNSGNPTTFCEGGSVILTASAGACTGCTYTWSNGFKGEVLAVKTSGNFTVTASNGCGSATAVMAVTVKPSPSVNVSATTTSICNGGSTQLTASGATEYLWIPTAGLSPTVGAVVTASPMVTTEYAVIGSADGCTATKRIVISVVPFLTPAIAVTNTGCNIGDITFSSSITNGGTVPIVQWFVNNILTAQGGTFIISNPAPGTQVFARLTSSTACGSASSVNSAVTTLNCVITSLPDIDGLEAFGIAPNPTTGMINIKLTLRPIRKVSFEITDSWGRLTYAAEPKMMTGTVLKQIDLGASPKGLYYLKTTIGGKTTTNKIVVSR